MKKVKKETIIRTAVLLLAIVNNALAIAGKSPLPFDDQTVTEVISFAFTTAASLDKAPERLDADQHLRHGHLRL